MGVGREGGLAGLRYIQALDTLDAFSLVEITASETNGNPELVMHALAQGVVQSLLAPYEDAVREQATKVLNFCLTEVRSWEVSASVTPGMLEAKLEDIWAQRADRENAEKLSASEQYTRFKEVRYFANLARGQLAIFRDAKKVHEYLVAHPGERFGTAAFLYSDPDIGFRHVEIPTTDDDQQEG